MLKSIFSPAARFALTLALVLTFLTPPCLAAEYNAIIYNFGKKPRNAYMDVSLDTRATATGPISINFFAFDPAGNQLANFQVDTNAKGFVSTAWFGNLFDLSGGQPMLIRARTPNVANSSDTLYLDSLGAPLTVGVPPIKKLDGSALGMGTEFSVGLGNFRSASLLIGNVSGADQVADVWLGQPGRAGGGIYSNSRLPANGIWKVDLTQNEAFSNIVITATSYIIVQVVIDEGRSIQSFTVLPAS